MNLKTIFAACLQTTLSVGAIPAMAQSDAAPETYTYDTKLDISQVLSLTEDSGQNCSLVDAQMVYLDSMGEKRTLTYRKLPANCSDG